MENNGENDVYINDIMQQCCSYDNLQQKHEAFDN